MTLLWICQIVDYRDQSWLSVFKHLMGHEEGFEHKAKEYGILWICEFSSRICVKMMLSCDIT